MAIVLNENTLLTGAIVAYPFTTHEFLNDPKYTEGREFKKWIRSLVKVVFKHDDGDQKVEIDKVIFHPKYKFINNDYTKNITLDNDIALIKLKRKIKFGKIQPACLDTIEQEYYEGALNVAGYGLNNTKAEEMKNLGLEYSKEFREGEMFDVTKTNYQCEGKENKLMCIDGSKSSTFYSLCTGIENKLTISF